MIHSEQVTDNYADYLIGSSSIVFTDPTGYVVEGHSCSWDGIVDGSGFSDGPVKSLYDGTQSAFVDAIADVPIDVPPLTESLINHYDVKSYDSIIDLAGLSCSTQYGSSCNERVDALVENSWTDDENFFSKGKSIDMECQQSESHTSQHHAVNRNNAHDILSNLEGNTARPCSSAAPLKSMPRNRSEKTKLADYNRRTIMNERLRALQQLLPETLKGNNRDAIIDNAMGQIEHLQLQLKELSASRLGGETIATSLIYFEGHGHYYPHDKMFKESLEEVVGSLIEENPVAASKLLKERGLYMMPIASVDALRGAGQT